MRASIRYDKYHLLVKIKVYKVLINLEVNKLLIII